MTKTKREVSEIKQEESYTICGWCKHSVHLPIKEYPSALIYCNNKQADHYLDFIVSSHESCDLYEVRR